jgi:pimeloyl-ACP methyl ester carboxylesterase
MPTAKVGDINIYYEIHGKGEPLVLIYGYVGHSGLWFRQIPTLSKKYRVIAFDNRGIGQSDKPDIPYTMAMMAADIAGLLDIIGIDAAHVFGISMGGMIAQHFALNYPQRVISLILGCTYCGGLHSILPKPEVFTAFFDFATFILAIGVSSTKPSSTAQLKKQERTTK